MPLAAYAHRLSQKLIPCPTCPRRMVPGGTACCVCRAKLRAPKTVRVPCPTCKHRMIAGETCCGWCRFHKGKRIASRARRSDLQDEGPQFTTKCGLEIDVLRASAADEKDARAARVRAYAAQVGEDGRGMISYQAGIRVAVGA